jgi:hypothetical protein
MIKLKGIAKITPEELVVRNAYGLVVGKNVVIWSPLQPRR